MKTIVVASKNPVKINATLSGFRRMFPTEEFEAMGVTVASGVSDQPKSDEETFLGASNRAERAMAEQTGADYSIGIEGGVRDTERGMEAIAWVVVKSKDGRFGKARMATFFLPPPVAALINQGKELGEADDIVFGRTNSKQQNGAIGLLTGDVITRADYYGEAVVMALVPFKNPDLYGSVDT